MILTFNGIEYELRGMTFGESLDIMGKSFRVSGADKDDVQASIDMNYLYTNQILKVLKRWTYRGYNVETNELIKEGDILPITIENIKSLPNAHGEAVYKTVKELLAPGRQEEKK